MPLTITKFSATWCHPCALLKPHWDRFVAEHPDAATFVTVDIDANPVAATSAQVRSVPTIVLERDGKEVGRLHGAPKTYVALRQQLAPYLTPTP